MLTFTSGHKGLSACTCMILTKNNAGTIRACLDSVIHPGVFTKVLILIDVKSSDGTGRIIQEYADRFPEIQIVGYKWSKPADFAAVRNFAISIMRTPYGFWLDGDEVLQKAAEIRWMLWQARGQAFQMWVISPKSGGGFHNMFQPRLFPVVRGVMFECPVFERLDWSLTRSGVRIQMTEYSPIYHPGYEDPAILRKKNERNMRIMRKYLNKHRKDDQQRQHIAQQYRTLAGK